MARKLRKRKGVDLTKLDYFVFVKADRAVDDPRYFGIVMLHAAPVAHVADGMTKAEFEADERPKKKIAHHLMMMGLN